MLMSAGDLPFIALLTFAAVAVLVPTVSFLLLRRERDSIAEFYGRESLAPIIFTEVLLWLAAVLVVGYGFFMLLALSVYVNAHGRADASAAVAAGPLLVVLSILAGMCLFGAWLHAGAVDRLWRCVRPQSNIGMQRTRNKQVS